MTREELFDLWAPVGGAWSDWAKPVLFAHMPRGWTHGEAGVELPVVAMEGLELSQNTAVVIDLPGEASVIAGMALVGRGYRPVPLFNGVPDSEAVAMAEVESTAVAARATVDVWPLMRAVWLGAEVLKKAALLEDAPPAFLLDSRRRMGSRAPLPGMMDNRWLSLPTDFPSARVLMERGIQGVVVISESAEPAADLGHTLMRWQEAGMAVRAYQLGEGRTKAITVRRPRWFQAAMYHFLTVFRLQRAMLGGFGGRVPNPGSGGGG